MSNEQEMRKEHWVFAGIGEMGGRRTCTYIPLQQSGRELSDVRYTFPRDKRLPVIGGVYEVTVTPGSDGTVRYVSKGAADAPRLLRLWDDERLVAQWRAEVTAQTVKEAAKALESKAREGNTDLSAMRLSELRTMYRRALGDIGRGAVIAAIIGYLNEPGGGR